MKIAILTLPLHTNYGGILQAYALQRVLEQLGNDVIVLQHKWKDRPQPISYTIKRTLRLFFKWLIKDKNTIIFPNRYLTKNNQLFCHNINEFISKYINTYNINRLDDCNHMNFDAIVVGSDQIWRPQYFKKMWEEPIEYAFLSFVKSGEAKKIAYACSFGTDVWEYTKEETTTCRKYAQEFDLLTCRESSGVGLVEKYFEKKSSLVLDPTLLLDKNDYEELINQNNPDLSNVGIFAYILDESDLTKRILDNISTNQGLQIIQYRIKPVIRRKSISSNIYKHVEEWLKCFRDAKLVITDSFHACVFSIIFKKPFLVLMNSNRGAARINSFLQMLGLESHIISDIGDYDPNATYAVEDCVYDKLDELRNLSLELLKNNAR